MLKVSPKYRKVITQVAREFTRRRDFTKGNFQIPERTAKEIVRKIAMKNGYKTPKVDSGAFRVTLILRNSVIKFPMAAESRDRMEHEIKFIRETRKNRSYRRHIVDTKAIRTDIGLVFVQERVDTKHPLPYFRLEPGVQALADRIGIGDCHCNNYGWAGPKGKRYPVFFDLEFTYKRKNRPAKKLTKLESEFVNRSWQFGQGLVGNSFDTTWEEPWATVSTRGSITCNCTDCRHDRGEWTPNS